jgi:hypothetical protein
METHRWMAGHIIALIEYCERQGLDDLSASLTEAMEKTAPRLCPANSAAPLLRLVPAPASAATE